MTSEPLPDPSEEDVANYLEAVSNFLAAEAMKIRRASVQGVTVAAATVTATATVPQPLVRTTDGPTDLVGGVIEPTLVVSSLRWAQGALQRLPDVVAQGIIQGAAWELLKNPDPARDLAQTVVTFTGAQLVDLARIVVEIRSQLP